MRPKAGPHGSPSDAKRRPETALARLLTMRVQVGSTERSADGAADRGVDLVLACQLEPGARQIHRSNQRRTVRRPDDGDIVVGAETSRAGLVADAPAVRKPRAQPLVTGCVGDQPARELITGRGIER